MNNATNEFEYYEEGYDYTKSCWTFQNITKILRLMLQQNLQTKQPKKNIETKLVSHGILFNLDLKSYYLTLTNKLEF